jgi:hypothetical protein
MMDIEHLTPTEKQRLCRLVGRAIGAAVFHVENSEMDLDQAVQIATWDVINAVEMGVLTKRKVEGQPPW